MRRITINALVDIGCLITFIPSFVSGLVLFFLLPSGGGRWSSQTVYLGLARDQWLNMHNYWSLAFSAMLIIHLILHWMYFVNIRKCLKPGPKDTEACEA
jgi:hypothetical protein